MIHGGMFVNPSGEYLASTELGEIRRVMTVHETRRARLLALIEKFGSLAALAERLGRARNDTANLSRIANANVRHERGGTTYVMGDDLARSIEAALQLPTGWMDTPAIAEQASNDPRIKEMVKLLTAMDSRQRDQAMKIVAALAEPSPAIELTGTVGE